MRRFLLFSLCSALVFTAVLFGSSARPASASVPIDHFSYAGGGVCQATSVSIPINASGYRPIAEPFTTILRMNGVVYNSFTGTDPAKTYSGVSNYGGIFSTQSFPYTFNWSTVYSIDPYHNFSITAVCSAAGAGPAVTISYYTGAALFNDGRLNSNDGAETFALYCDGDVITVFAVDPVTSKGTLAFTVTPAELSKFPVKPGTAIKIKSAMGATLYRLTTGELQVNRLETTGKIYKFIFNGCPA